MKDTFNRNVIIYTSSLTLVIILILSVVLIYFKYSLSYLEPSGYVEGSWVELPEKHGEFRSIAFGAGVFVGVGSEEIASSLDGETWTYHLTDSKEETRMLNDITYGNGRFVAVGYREIITSLDGVNWSKIELEIKNPLQSVTYGNGVFVAVGSGGYGAVMRSNDGLIWEKYESYPHWDVCYGDGLFVAVGAYEASFSTDGISWTRVTIPEKSGGGYLTTVAYGNGQFIAVGARDDLGSVLWTSTNGSTWRAILQVKDHISDMTYAHGQFFLAGIQSFIYSEDGHAWDRKLLPPGLSLSGISYGINELVASSSHSKILIIK
ncbi:hypothetical protein LOZ80_30045 [Paenibacillus sp. HWE-109]|uniref:hypothetical protein n=1 Tax=Paenibacillus sp. HWE-109 TaxID=1306526 RepID=UPI001EE044CF|nr:hypothetical protein [Paenibacillus sp. HWE-109]UKS25763.1 hypothetical protein LOZ80_30045 [Paenibacillus sp. HWE-109]